MRRDFPRELATAGGVTAATIAAWILLADLRPGVTYHLAPLLAALAATVYLRMVGETARAGLGRAALVGAVLTLAATAALGASGRLEGPSLLPWGEATFESVVAAGAGALIAAAVAATAPRTTPAR